MKKLVLFGDSLLANFNKPFSGKLEQVTNCEVYNCATCGWDTSDGVQKAPYISNLKPDVVVFSFGTNDSSPWRQLPITTVTENLSKIFVNFRGSEMIFLLPPPINEDRQEPNKQRLNTTIEQYANAIKVSVEQENIKYIDSWKVFRDILDSKQDYHEEDGIHFNDLGYETVINAVARLLAEL